MPPRSVGVAFQGGGAKLIGLIAAADAIAGLVTDGDLKIERISGTSAGSLAALLLASQVDFNKVKVAIRKQESLIKKSFPKPGSVTTFSKVGKFMTRGIPFYSSHDFNRLLEAILLEVGIDINQQMQNAIAGKIPLDIIVSDLFLGNSVAFSTGSLRDVLRRSCAIPVIFASHKADDQGQYADGGIFDNLPTEILVDKLGSDVPVFAVGFQPEKAATVTNAFDYITTLIGSVVTNNVARSAGSIGMDYVCPVATKLKTLDFDKMVSVGLNEEYDAIRAATVSFFKKWLQGNSNHPPQNAGQRALSKLKNVEGKLVKHVEAAFRAAPGRHAYVTMSVIAHSLSDPRRPDEIETEDLLVLPAGSMLHGAIMPLLDGTGSLDRIECVVKTDGPNGDALPFTEFIIDDELMIRGLKTRRSSLVILFSNQITTTESRRLFISKKETRFGFMSPLRSGQDVLALTSAYWATEAMTIRLTVPPEYRNLQSHWSGKGSATPVSEPPQAWNYPQAGWMTVAATLAAVSHEGELRGMFTRPVAG